ncbi:MAG TPA: acyl-CoA dehydrogenase family protein [Alphaproteobacteria bacterium]|nr:acyl-CoA dehydrogenase family protein [Alphaproteobacteria bacterium]
MDFSDTREEAEYRAKVRAFLDANAEKREPGKLFQAKYGDDNLVPLAKKWQRKKYDAGFAGITLPKEYGGQGGTQIQQVIYNQEEQNYLVPRGVYEIGLGMCIPTMLTYATEAQKQRYAPAALKGDEIWCQLFSEPAAGSDVANSKTRALRDGDDWIINGQKIWTSGAHFSDFGIIVVRTDPSVPKHKGMSFFFLDMKSPGIEVRRIKQISGTSNFNEVFFTDVRVPDSQRLGGVGEGWRVALTTLMNERLAVGMTPPPDFDEIFAFTRSVELESGPAIRDSSVRERLADWYVEMQGLKLTQFRTITALSRGEAPGPEASITKIISANKRQDIANFAMDLMEQGGVAMGADQPMAGLFQEAMLSSPSGRIAGGTDEILRNIIAERVLGLPQDIRVDKDVPFDQLPSGR